MTTAYKMIEQTLHGHTMLVAVNLDGVYIGLEADAKRLCDEKGISPIGISRKSQVCSIGFCENDQKWYGWSHRAIYGFGIGSVVEKGDCAYVPVDWKDFLSDRTTFWSGENKLDVTSIRDGDLAVTSWRYDGLTPNRKIRGQMISVTSNPPEKWGRGEWEAKSLDDAREMAIAFAESVS
jgi:hypothetical protein